MSRVLCAMSGGVDSSVSALLLREAGHEVIGVFMTLGPDAGPGAGARGCCSVADSRDAALVASRLGIPFYAVDHQRDFRRIVDDFVEEYHRGRTPNPCVRCNQWLKFGTLLERAEDLGCDAIATGHYARIDLAGPGGGPRLLRGADPEKDQSYFLFAIGRAAVARAIFPVGGLRKPEVRALASRAGLPVAGKPDSQEICFVPGDYREVLRARGEDRIRPGRFLDVQGADLGEHPGHQGFTIGQRRGLGAHGSPRYVVAIDAARNEVVLGAREDLEASSFRVTEVSWASIDPPPPGERLEAHVQIRHRHRPAPATITVEEGGRARIDLGRPETAVTPGQAAVFYGGEVLLGGGWIEETGRS